MVMPRTSDIAPASAQAAQERSVVPVPEGITPRPGVLLLNWLGGYADAIPTWGTNPKGRDAALRALIPQEPYFASAMGIIAARNAAMSWQIKGDQATAEAAVAMLNNADAGGGWEHMIAAVTIDLCTQDTGAFIEIIRSGDSPTSPVIGIQHLDSERCWPTGVPDTPVIYQDWRGRMHYMRWYQVVHLMEMPSPWQPSEWYYRLQYSALTRMLRAVQILRSVSVYKDEKLAGRFSRGLVLLQGIDEANVQASLTQAQVLGDAAGRQRYNGPVMVGTVDPNAKIDAKVVDIAGMPDGFTEEQTIKDYITVLAMAFLTDYQEFAPLPGGNLGTSAQSETLHQKSKGKGAGLFRKLIARVMNGIVLPANVEFAWDETDLEADLQLAKVKRERAEERSIRVTSGEITPEVAAQLAVDAGDLPAEIYDEMMAGVDQTEDMTVEGEGNPTMSDKAGEVSAESPAVTRMGLITDAVLLGSMTLAGRKAQGPTVPMGPLIASRLHRAYSTTSDDLTGLGYFADTAERIEVASAIGPALAVFEERLRAAGLWDAPVAADDADRMVDALMGTHAMGDDADAPDSPPPHVPEAVGITHDRLEYEADSAAHVMDGLSAARKIVRDRLMGARSADLPVQWTMAPAPPVGSVKEIVRDAEGRIAQIIERPVPDNGGS